MHEYTQGPFRIWRTLGQAWTLINGLKGKMLLFVLLMLGIILGFIGVGGLGTYVFNKVLGMNVLGGIWLLICGIGLIFLIANLLVSMNHLGLQKITAGKATIRIALGSTFKHWFKIGLLVIVTLLPFLLLVFAVNFIGFLIASIFFPHVKHMSTMLQTTSSEGAQFSYRQVASTVSHFFGNAIGLGILLITMFIGTCINILGYLLSIFAGFEFIAHQKFGQAIGRAFEMLGRRWVRLALLGPAIGLPILIIDIVYFAGRYIASQPNLLSHFIGVIMLLTSLAFLLLWVMPFLSLVNGLAYCKVRHELKGAANESTTSQPS